MDKSLQLKTGQNEKYFFKLFHSWPRLYAFICMLITFPIVVFVFYNLHDGLWFDSLQYLTDQGNLIFWSFLLLYALLNKNRTIFKNNYFLICALSYITFVFIGFNTLLLPGMVANKEFETGYDWTSTVWYHMLSPIVDISFGVVILLKVNHGIPKVKIIGYGYLYVTYQLIYFICLPFISVLVHQKTKKATYAYLNLAQSNNLSMGACTPYSFNGTNSSHTILSLANQILSHYNGSQKVLLAHAMITKWFSVNNVQFVSFKNNILVVSQIPTTSQLAHIYYNLGVSYDAISNINANSLQYFYKNQFSVYGTITNLNPNVNLYYINHINESAVCNKIYASLTSSNFNPSTSYNLYNDYAGNYAMFGLVAGALVAYLIFLSFWWFIAKTTQKRFQHNLKSINVIH